MRTRSQGFAFGQVTSSVKKGPDMNTPPDEAQAKRNASMRSSFTTSRVLTVVGIVLAFILFAIFIPW